MPECADFMQKSKLRLLFWTVLCHHAVESAYWIKSVVRADAGVELAERWRMVESQSGEGLPPRTPTLAEAEEREERAYTLVQRYALGVGALGLVPIPVLDILPMTWLLLLMLRDLGALYGQSFSGKQRRYEVLGALLGGVALPALTFPTLLSVAKWIPGVGTAVATLILPLFAGTIAYAVGLTFIQHFETGGTLLSFNPKALRRVFIAYYNEGRDSAAQNGADHPSKEG